MKAAHGLFHRKKCCKLTRQSEKLRHTEKARESKIERQNDKDQQSLLLFTRLPILGKTKTRLVPHIGEEGALQVHWAILKDFSAVWKKLKRKEKKLSLLVFYNMPKGIAKEQWETALDCLKSLFPKASFQRQEGKDIFDKMENAFRYSFSKGSSFSYLVGADIPFMEAEHFQRVFALGRKGRQVLGASLDEGYYGIGLQRRIEPELLHACFSYQAVQENRTILAASTLRNGRSIPKGKAIRAIQRKDPFPIPGKSWRSLPFPLAFWKKRGMWMRDKTLMHTEACIPMIRGFANPPSERRLRKMRKFPSLSPATRKESCLEEWNGSFDRTKKTWKSSS